ncbi:hypothetical protein AA16663_1127 [Komagataeibacter rhaeticus DSM 16663]|nr:hypothetical protein AA16663_1127 [Komagataeibacter rhaeticus DSM 16663]
MVLDHVPPCATPHRNHGHTGTDRHITPLHTACFSLPDAQAGTGPEQYIMHSYARPAGLFMIPSYTSAGGYELMQVIYSACPAHGVASPSSITASARPSTPASTRIMA